MKTARIGFLLVLAMVGVGSGFWFTGGPRTELPGDPIGVSLLLDEYPDGFPGIQPDKPIVFPQDHGPHPKQPMESWAFNAFLTTKEGRRFGFQLGIFRFRLVPGNPERKSAWSTTEIYRGHMALTDIARQKFHSYERFSRAALELSGARSMPVRVWVEDWSIEILPEINQDSVFRLAANQGDLQVDLSLTSEKPAIQPTGDALTARAVNQPFASYFLTRLAAEGTLKVGEHAYSVQGVAWLDRIWGEVPLPLGATVWNRFLLQLEDGSEILVFQLRRRDGSGNPINTGLVINPDGSTENFGRKEVELKILDHWVSSKGGARYPMRWQLQIPGKTVELFLQPELTNQELNVSLRYWAGIVTLSGKAMGQPASGHGFMELTGYAKESADY